MIAQKSLSGWQHAELTPEQWIEKLDAGQTIQPSAFTPKSDSTFTHKVENWIETYFVCADADNIKGVEFLDDGSDKNPEGVEPWTENGLLSKKFPGLTAKVYAVGESVSSMLVDPLHRRYRFVFLFDKPITSEKHYHHILLRFANEFSIIPAVTRSPAQPVFGNAREEFNFHICGSTLNLADYPFEPKTDEIKSRLKTSKNPSKHSKSFSIDTISLTNPVMIPTSSTSNVPTRTDTLTGKAAKPMHTYSATLLDGRSTAAIPPVNKPGELHGKTSETG